MNTKQQLEIIKAYEEGKTIIERAKGSSSEWIISKDKIEDYQFNFMTCEYSVKGEEGYQVMIHGKKWIEIRALRDAIDYIERMEDVTGFMIDEDGLLELKMVVA